MNMFARLDIIPALTLQDSTDGRENSIPSTNTVCGFNNVNINLGSSFEEARKAFTQMRYTKTKGDDPIVSGLKNFE